MRANSLLNTVSVVNLNTTESTYHFPDPPEDDLRDLRDDGVSEASKAVHPVGYPMSHSTHVGFNRPSTSISRIDQSLTA